MMRLDGRLFYGLAVVAVAALAESPTSHPNFTGFWELRFDSKNVPPAALTATVAAENRNVQYELDMRAIRWCHFFGVPYVMEGATLDILENQSGRDIVISSSLRSPARHIYVDHRGHVNPDTFDPVSNGHSIGRWEGETLVVDTIGFSSEGLTAIPGGGRRTPDSHLVERYRLLDGGNRLSVVFSWEDSKVFAQPHTYEFRYYRAPKGTEAREFDCSAADTERAKFLTEPPK
jgi:hypothetical protein